MRPRLIFSFMRVSVTILFYLLLVFGFIFLVASFANIFMNNTDHTKKGRINSYTEEVVSFGTKNSDLPTVYSPDSAVNYQEIKNRYHVKVEPKSGFGYYILLTKLIFISLGIAVLWNFKKIFQETNVDDPFKPGITRRLKILAALFIISDVVKFIHYFLFNSYLRQSISSPRFELLTEIGDGIITGLIIYVIAIIYQRGIALQEENALTV